MSNNVLIADDGRIVEPNVHDARIIGLFTPDNNRLLIPMVMANKSNICITFNELKRLRVDDFREGNIILDITVTSGADAEINDIAYAHGLEQPTHSVTNLYLDKAVHNFLNSKELLVQMNPSYGCKLVCICGGIEVLHNWTSIIAGRLGPGQA